MIQKALEYIVGLKEPKVQEINGETYSDKHLNRICYNPKAEAIHLTTLSSLVEYIKSGVDTMKGKMFVHVVSPTQVNLYSQLDDERGREYVATVAAKVPSFDFDKFLDREKFNIALQSKFIENPDRALLLQFAGTVESGSVTEYSDDGVTQKATVKTGIANKQDAIVPNPVTLMPYRTFIEVEQPESTFVFRMEEDKYSGGVNCGIFEADGGAWENEAMQNIKAYLMRELDGMADYTVIS